MNITKPNVYTRITSRTIGVSQICSDMKRNSVKIGKVEPLSHAMKKDVRDFNHASLVMDGKSSNSIH